MRGLVITRNIATDGPRQAVFQTAELLENILLRLPVKSVFKVLRVCRQFRDIVDTSAAIRQMLFIQSSAEERQTWAVHWAEARDRYRGTHIEAYFVNKTKAESVETTPGQVFNPARLNPLYVLRTHAMMHQANSY